MDVVVILILLAILIAVIVGWWAMFEKAGFAGWLSLIPIVNTIFLIRVSGNPYWMVLLLFIPVVNFFLVIFVFYSLTERFGQGFLYFLGILFLPFIFMPLLGLGPAQYRPVGAQTGAQMPYGFGAPGQYPPQKPKR